MGFEKTIVRFHCVLSADCVGGISTASVQLHCKLESRLIIFDNAGATVCLSDVKGSREDVGWKD